MVSTLRDCFLTGGEPWVADPPRPSLRFGHPSGGGEHLLTHIVDSLSSAGGAGGGSDVHRNQPISVGEP